MVAAAGSCEQAQGEDLYQSSRYRVVRLGRCHRELCQYLIAQFLDTPCDLFRPQRSQYIATPAVNISVPAQPPPGATCAEV
jgi:hypothetical protein